MAKKLKFSKKPTKRKKGKADRTAFNFGANAPRKRKGGFGGGS